MMWIIIWYFCDQLKVLVLELIPTSDDMKPYKIGIFFSDLDYGTFAEVRLRDVPYEVFEAYKDRLPKLWCRRAEHFTVNLPGRREA